MQQKAEGRSLIAMPSGGYRVTILSMAVRARAMRVSQRTAWRHRTMFLEGIGSIRCLK
jgi:hypothetical protein